MADKSFSLAPVMPSIFIDTIVNIGPEKDRFRRGVIDLPDIIVLLRNVVAPGCGRISWCLKTPLLGDIA